VEAATKVVVGVKQQICLFDLVSSCGMCCEVSNWFCLLLCGCSCRVVVASGVEPGILGAGVSAQDIGEDHRSRGHGTATMVFFLDTGVSCL